jgi:hypothetical protein
MAPQTNAYERIKLVEEQVKITLSETAAVTNTYNVWLKVTDK